MEVEVLWVLSMWKLKCCGYLGLSIRHKVLSDVRNYTVTLLKWHCIHCIFPNCWSQKHKSISKRMHIFVSCKRNALEARWSAILFSPLLLGLKQGWREIQIVFLYFVFLINWEMYDVQNAGYWGQMKKTKLWWLWGLCGKYHFIFFFTLIYFLGGKMCIPVIVWNFFFFLILSVVVFIATMCWIMLLLASSVCRTDRFSRDIWVSFDVTFSLGVGSQSLLSLLVPSKSFHVFCSVTSILIPAKTASSASTARSYSSVSWTSVVVVVVGRSLIVESWILYLVSNLQSL